MKTLLSFLCIAIIASIGCADVTIDVENICSSRDFMLPGVNAAISAVAGERTVRRDTDQDISTALSKLSDFGNIHLTSVQLTLNGDNLSFLHHIKVVLHSENEDLLLSDSDVTVDGFTVNVPISTDKDKLLTLLEGGKVTLQVFATGNIPTQETTTNNTFCVGVSAQGNKSIGDISK